MVPELQLGPLVDSRERLGKGNGLARMLQGFVALGHLQLVPVLLEPEPALCRVQLIPLALLTQTERVQSRLHRLLLQRGPEGLLNRGLRRCVRVDHLNQALVSRHDPRERPLDDGAEIGRDLAPEDHEKALETSDGHAGGLALTSSRKLEVDTECVRLVLYF